MSENVHYENASAAFTAVNSSASDQWNEECRWDAAIHATLASVYEQRTANLIALLDAGFTSAKVAGVDYTDVADAIKERLGL